MNEFTQITTEILKMINTEDMKILKKQDAKENELLFDIQNTILNIEKFILLFNEIKNSISINLKNKDLDIDNFVFKKNNLIDKNSLFLFYSELPFIFDIKFRIKEETQDLLICTLDSYSINDIDKSLYICKILEEEKKDLKKYIKEYAIDINMSVKWNDNIKDILKKILELIELFNKEYSFNLLKLGKEYIINEIINSNISLKQANIIYDYAYEEKHSNGLPSIYDLAVELAELYNKIYQSK